MIQYYTGVCGVFNIKKYREVMVRSDWYSLRCTSNIGPVRASTWHGATWTSARALAFFGRKHVRMSSHQAIVLFQTWFVSHFSMFITYWMVPMLREKSKKPSNGIQRLGGNPLLHKEEKINHDGPLVITWDMVSLPIFFWWKMKHRWFRPSAICVYCSDDSQMISKWEVRTGRALYLTLL